MTAKVSVIIATAGQKERAASLLAAVESVEQQIGVDVTIIMVFNGPNVCESIKNTFSNRVGVEVQYQAQPSLPNALNYAVSLVNSDYFCFLDDDDLYIKDTLRLRCNILDKNPEIDVVATNGLIDCAGEQSLNLPDDFQLTQPLEQLFTTNWLASCGGLFRCSTIDKRYFKKDVKYYEWTMTAFLVAQDKNVSYLSEPTFIVNKTQGSLSATNAYDEARPEFYNTLLDYPIPMNIKNIIKQRRTESYHHLSSICLNKKQYKNAWKFHVKSLMSLSGWKYIAYTRHFLY